MSLARGRRVVIVGSGKTAMDCASGLLVSRCAASVTLLYRSAHWPVPRSVLGIPVRRLLFSRAVASMLPPYYTASCVDRAVHAIVRPLKRLFWRGLECAINKKLHMGNGKLEAPPVGLPGDLFYGGQILDDSGAEMMHCEQLTAIKGDFRNTHIHTYTHTHTHIHTYTHTHIHTYTHTHTHIHTYTHTHTHIHIHTYTYTHTHTHTHIHIHTYTYTYTHTHTHIHTY
ncbi:hypothetical protein Vretifemale_4905, partial [Volvox reticuliferus]